MLVVLGSLSCLMQRHEILTFMSYTGECWQQKHTQHAPSTKKECDYLNGWIKKRSHRQKSHPKFNGEPQRSSWGMQKKKKKMVWLLTLFKVAVSITKVVYSENT